MLNIYNKSLFPEKPPLCKMPSLKSFLHFEQTEEKQKPRLYKNCPGAFFSGKNRKKFFVIPAKTKRKNGFSAVVSDKTKLRGRFPEEFELAEKTEYHVVSSKKSEAEKWKTKRNINESAKLVL